MNEQLRAIIEASDNIVFFGGAGVSTASGIPDFRGSGGLYHQTYAESPETILSHAYFMAHTEQFYDFYRDKMLYLKAQPNRAHSALAELERVGKLRAVITQNIDGLHQAAGSKTVLELHGSVHRNHCMHCGKFYGVEHIERSKGVPRCACGDIVKPDVVLYGESLDSAVLSASMAYIAACEVLIIGGTGLAVYPAAGLINDYRGDKLVVINKSTTSADSRAKLVIVGDIAEAFEE